MRTLICGMILLSGLVFSNPVFASDSVALNAGQMDSAYASLQDKSNQVSEKIKAAAVKIEEAKKHKTNYWLPIVGGAVLGIGLAWWLRRKKG